MVALFIFACLILGIALVCWMVLDLVWKAGLWKMNRNVRKRGEREQVQEEGVRKSG
jgi:hypothetical protein